MFIKNILMAFKRETPIEVWEDDWLNKSITTVGQFMDNGLMTYTVVDIHNLFYINTDGKIVIYLGDI